MLLPSFPGAWARDKTLAQWIHGGGGPDVGEIEAYTGNGIWSKASEPQFLHL